jgi:hypothetical protein
MRPRLWGEAGSELVSPSRFKYQGEGVTMRAMMQAVPEPGSLLLIPAGFAPLLHLARSRRVMR